MRELSRHVSRYIDWHALTFFGAAMILTLYGLRSETLSTYYIAVMFFVCIALAYIVRLLRVVRKDQQKILDAAFKSDAR